VSQVTVYRCGKNALKVCSAPLLHVTASRWTWISDSRGCRIAPSRETAEIGLLKIVPAVLQNEPVAVKEALRRARDQAARTDYYINLIGRHVERGGKPSEGRTAK
jgi:hypothetical protein